MNKVILDEATRAKLNGLNDIMEFCDEQGHSLGHFNPSPRPDPELYAKFKSPFSDEELERRSQQPGGSTLSEFWRKLGRS